MPQKPNHSQVKPPISKVVDTEPASMALVVERGMDRVSVTLGPPRKDDDIPGTVIPALL